MENGLIYDNQTLHIENLSFLLPENQNKLTIQTFKPSLIAASLHSLSAIRNLLKNGQTLQSKKYICDVEVHFKFYTGRKLHYTVTTYEKSSLGNSIAACYEFLR